MGSYVITQAHNLACMQSCVLNKRMARCTMQSASDGRRALLVMAMPRQQEAMQRIQHITEACRARAW